MDAELIFSAGLGIASWLRALGSPMLSRATMSSCCSRVLELKHTSTISCSASFISGKSSTVVLAPAPSGATSMCSGSSEVCTMDLTINFGVIGSVGAVAGTVGIVVAPALSIVLPAALNLSLTVLRVASHSAVFARLP